MNSKAIPTRWPENLVELIDSVRGEQSFSDFVREAAREKATAGAHPQSPSSLLESAGVPGDEIPLSDPLATSLAGADSPPSSEVEKTAVVCKCDHPPRKHIRWHGPCTACPCRIFRVAS